MVIRVTPVRAGELQAKLWIYVSTLADRTVPRLTRQQPRRRWRWQRLCCSELQRARLAE